jgi:hypothetical protein
LSTPASDRERAALAIIGDEAGTDVSEAIAIARRAREIALQSIWVGMGLSGAMLGASLAHLGIGEFELVLQER